MRTAGLRRSAIIAVLGLGGRPRSRDRRPDIAAWIAPVRHRAGRHDLRVASARLDEARDLLMRVLAGS